MDVHNFVKTYINFKILANINLKILISCNTQIEK